MKALKYYGVKNLTFRGTPLTVSMARARTAAHAAVRAATLATALGSLGINNAVAQTTVQVTGGAESQSSIQVDVETCQALSDAQLWIRNLSGHALPATTGIWHTSTNWSHN